MIIILIFLILLYLLGSCCSRSEVNETSVIFKNYDNPDDYEKALDEYMKTGKMSFSYGLTARADFCEDWEVGFNDIKDYASDSWDKLKNFVNKTPFFTKNNGYDEPAIKGKENNPAYVPTGDTYVIPHEYEMYGKRIVEYSGGTSELIEVYLFTSDVSTTDSTGYVQVRRRSDIGSTSFSCHIMLKETSTVSGSFYGNTFRYYPLGYLSHSGCDETFTKQMVTEPGVVAGKGTCNSSFFVENTNSIHVDKFSTTKSISQLSACGGHLTVCSVKSNDYDYVNNVNIHCNNKKVFSPFIFLYGNVNFRAGDIINKFNIDNYVDVGFNYDTTTNNISFSPDIYNNYWDLNIKPELEIEYNRLFNSFPDIDVTFPDSDGNRNNLVVIQQPPDPATTYPVATGDVNVSVEVDVTFPPEFYDEYPPLDTTPAFIAENPDLDYALDSPLPLEILETSGNILAMATDIINDSGLMPVYLMCISLGLVAFFLL